MKKDEQLKKRVLIVDDEEDILILLKKVISRSCSCSVELASSATQALQIANSWQPDVVLTDIKMPDLDGLELLKKIADLDSTITTVIMTGYGTIEIAVQALKD
ncbi:MAG: response regulator, partial [Deltaproteobacteria bacterium]|nr:response regulator [Deltaproteobacteria bacterium]